MKRSSSCGVLCVVEGGVCPSIYTREECGLFTHGPLRYGGVHPANAQVHGRRSLGAHPSNHRSKAVASRPTGGSVEPLIRLNQEWPSWGPTFAGASGSLLAFQHRVDGPKQSPDVSRAPILMRQGPTAYAGFGRGFGPPIFGSIIGLNVSWCSNFDWCA